MLFSWLSNRNMRQNIFWLQKIHNPTCLCLEGDKLHLPTRESMKDKQKGKIPIFNIVRSAGYWKPHLFFAKCRKCISALSYQTPTGFLNWVLNKKNQWILSIVMKKYWWKTLLRNHVGEHDKSLYSSLRIICGKLNIKSIFYKKGLRKSGRPLNLHKFTPVFVCYCESHILIS